MYIDSRDRAETLARCLLCSPPPFIRSDPRVGHGLRELESLFLAPFPKEYDSFDPEVEWDNRSSPDEAPVIADSLSVSIMDSPVPASAPLSSPQHLEGGYHGSGSHSLEEDINIGSDPASIHATETQAALDSDDWSTITSTDNSWEATPSALDNLTVARAVREIFITTAPTLKRLIIDMPLRSLYPQHDMKSIRMVLRRAFKALVNMEEFVSIQDELYLDVSVDPNDDESLVWDTEWPKLRRLALYNTDLSLDQRMWRSMARLPYMEMAVFTDVDGIMDMDGNLIDIKMAWIQAVAATSAKSMDQILGDIRPFTFVCLDFISFGWSKLVPGWRELDPNNRIRVKEGIITKYDAEGMVVDPHSFTSVSDFRLNYERVRELAVQGRLWDAVTSDLYDSCYKPDRI